MEIDGAGGSVVVDVRVKVKPGVQKHRESCVACLVEGEPLRGKKCVMDEPLAIDGSDSHAAHIGVPRNIVQVVKGKNPTGQGLEEPHPHRFLTIVLAVLFYR